jgi:hypothetical protein
MFNRNLNGTIQKETIYTILLGFMKDLNLSSINQKFNEMISQFRDLRIVSNDQFEQLNTYLNISKI